MGHNGSGPPDHWSSFPTSGASSKNVLDTLNELATQGFDSVAVAVQCTDGPFVFVGGYKEKK